MADLRRHPGRCGLQKRREAELLQGRGWRCCAASERLQAVGVVRQTYKRWLQRRRARLTGWLGVKGNHGTCPCRSGAARRNGLGRKNAFYFCLEAFAFIKMLFAL